MSLCLDNSFYSFIQFIEYIVFIPPFQNALVFPTSNTKKKLSLKKIEIFFGFKIQTSCPGRALLWDQRAACCPQSLWAP